MTSSTEAKARQIMRELGMLDDSLDCIIDTKTIAEALNKEREMALEEAAKVADDMDIGFHDISEVAPAIRSLKSSHRQESGM